ncbi:hypothetical protein L4D76_02085 [Photobacterium sagamiensis]|uniref:hypothetical protein n=1 Tax=Photobacterium sagamiensis TaxID=2910241 RepID=UPI003D14615E
MKLNFSELNKQTKKSFGDQRAVIKRVMQGKTVLCPECGQPLRLVPPETSDKPGIACAKGCTVIELDFS